ncbi:DUF4199 domain-containing protein [Myroides phaeus]|uniref:DUF4199 domain-containing protein n=1 Tax=Myroides phaeus TaxID=702745 RepID=A0A1G8GSU7_9FLAO|nr:DUF4199 domain-containing protein [Myroides phaeus]MEC4117680.1 DUF4199 domain-containing protein [Myroides phaeus]SDH97474.1 Protein of unknown function [Myroides phaeus]
MKNFSIEFKWAALATLAALIWMFIIKSLGFHSIEKIRYEVAFELLFNILLTVFYWLGIRQKKYEFYNGIISWQRAFLSGLVICIMITFFFPLIQYITFYQVSPHFMDTFLEALTTQTNMSLDEAQKSASFDLFMRNGVTNNLSFGVIIVSIVSYFLQTKNMTPEAQRTIANRAEVVKVKKNKNKKK